MGSRSSGWLPFFLISRRPPPSLDACGACVARVKRSWGRWRIFQHAWLATAPQAFYFLRGCTAQAIRIPSA